MSLETNKTVKLLGRTFTIEYPNVGQNIDIAKAQSYYAPDSVSDREFILKDIHDALSFFRVMIKDFDKDFNFANPADMPMTVAKDVLRAYKTDIEPWVFSWEQEFSLVYQELSESRKKQADAETSLTESVNKEADA